MGRFSGIVRTSSVEGVCRLISDLSGGRGNGFKFGSTEVTQVEQMRLNAISNATALSFGKEEIGFVATSSVTAESVYDPWRVAFHVFFSVKPTNIFRDSKLLTDMYLPASESRSKEFGNTIPCLKTIGDVYMTNTSWSPIKAVSSTPYGKPLAKLAGCAAIASGFVYKFDMIAIYADIPTEESHISLHNLS